MLRLFKQEIAPHGTLQGRIFYNGKPLEELEPVQRAKDIGMVFQDPENQPVMDKVLEELVFGLENFGIPTDSMRKKVAEMVHYFGIHQLLDKKIHHLSGGQLQIINLASILLLEPEILLLDEPTARLDPVATKDFLQILKQLNEEFGITVIMVEHRLDDVFPLADRVYVLDQGKLYYQGKPKEVIASIWGKQHLSMFPYLPKTALLYFEHNSSPDTRKLPLTVKEGRQWINGLNIGGNNENTKNEQGDKSKTILSLQKVGFQYEKSGSPVLQDLSLSVYEGEWLAVVGANGTGKSTLLKIAAGVLQPFHGHVKYKGKKLHKCDPFTIGYLPQNPKILFVHDTVKEHLESTVDRLHIKDGLKKLNELITFFNLKPLLERHPYDVSGGEMQKIALATVLLSSPKILLLDEPTKGLDPEMECRFGNRLQQLQKNGLTIIMVTHDTEFAASFADRCAMMFQGEITTVAPTKDFFKGNFFYTTAINRITRGSRVPEVVTVEEAKERWMIK